MFVRTDAEADAENREGDAAEARRALVASDVEMGRLLVAASALERFATIQLCRGAVPIRG